MNRKDFIKSLSLIPLSGLAMKLQALQQLTQSFSKTELMPTLFIGHGSPMNAIETNEFSLAWQKLGKDLPKPNAIICVSAHWETKVTLITAMKNPKTIHDFGGFPQALFDVQYPAPGNKELALEIQKIITKTQIGLDEQWGLDHGTWSILKHLYPKADVPVLQLSLDYTKPAQYHYELAKELITLRKKGVLIIGSGNIVHNLGLVDWSKLHSPNYGFDWALEANTKIKEFVVSNNYRDLINYSQQGKAFQLAIPSPDHYLPLLYILGLKHQQDEVTVFNDKAVMGSLTMTSFMFASNK